MSVESLAIADVLVKVSIVLGVTMLISRLLARRSAALRHHVWAFALLASLLLPLLTTLAPRWRVAVLPSTSLRPGPSAAFGPGSSTSLRPGPSTALGLKRPDSTYEERATSDSAGTVQQMNIADDVGAPVTTAPGLIPQSSAPASFEVASVVTTIWLGGAVLLLARVGLGSARVWWMTRHARPAVEWLPLARHLATSLGLGSRVTFLSGDADAMPMTWGLRRARVLLPEDADEWPVSRQRVVLLHELAHVKRRDCLTQFIAHLACAAYWFNPLVWMAAHRLRAERERACDDLVLAAGTRGSEYADHLLDIARSMSAAAWPTWSAVTMAHRSQLEGRLMAILDPALSRRSPARGSVAFVGGLAIVAVTSLAVVRPVAKEADLVSETSAARDASAVTIPATASQAPVIAAPVVTVIAAQGRPSRPVISTPTPTPTPAPIPMPAPFAGIVPPDVHIDVDAIDSAIETSLNHAFAQAPQRAASASADPRVVSALSAALKDDDKEVRQQALHALVSMRAPIAADAYMSLLKDSDPEVRQQAVYGLGQLRDPKYFDVLLSALKDQNGEVRHHAAFALGQLRDARAVDPLVALLKDSDPEVREQAVFALGQIRDRRAIDPLIAALKDANAEVRRQAAFALGRLR